MQRPNLEASFFETKLFSLLLRNTKPALYSGYRHISYCFLCGTHSPSQLGCVVLGSHCHSWILQHWCQMVEQGWPPWTYWVDCTVWLMGEMGYCRWNHLCRSLNVTNSVENVKLLLAFNNNYDWDKCLCVCACVSNRDAMKDTVHVTCCHCLHGIRTRLWQMSLLCCYLWHISKVLNGSLLCCTCIRSSQLNSIHFPHILKVMCLCLSVSSP